MNKALFAALDMLESEKGIPKTYMYEKLEAALVSAYRREMGGSTNVRVQINEEKYDFKMFKRLDVVEEVTDANTQISLADAKKMLKDRVELFVRQAEDCGLELYKFSDGFFVTLKMDSNKQRDDYHRRLIDNHIYTIKVNKGIRLGLCSTPLKIVDGLAEKMKGLQ